jgi:hypothetical protein
VRLALRVVTQNDGDFVDVILVYRILEEESGLHIICQAGLDVPGNLNLQQHPWYNLEYRRILMNS